MNPTDPAAPSMPENPSRRDVLKAGAALAAGLAAGAPAFADELKPSGVQLFPEEFWRDRMTAPADGKRYGWLVDARRCFGCHGCEVACKAENDVPLGHFIRQTIYAEHAEADRIVRVMVPMSCQHCEDAPCIKACPCGALHKGAGGSVVVDYDKCSGHGACVQACPYGAIYMDPVANQAVKCHNCTHRIDVGLEPPCVATCPSEAIYFGDLNDPESAVSKARQRYDGKIETLRPEKGTNPRMGFITDDAHAVRHWETWIPGEGESYTTDAYDIHHWANPEGGKTDGR